MTISFLRRKKADPPPPPPTPVVEDVEAQEYSLRLSFMARSSDSLRFPAQPKIAAALPSIVEPLAKGGVETIGPLPLQYGDAHPSIERFTELQQWVLARREVSSVGRHALHVLELTDALDMTVDTFSCGLLHGETDTSGHPDYQAIVGGVASHWDEISGELIVRAVVGWGGRGLRGDSDRIGQKLVSALHANLLASGWSLGPAEPRLPRTHDRSGVTCAHCGFHGSASTAFYCTRCGMRMSRSA